MLHAGRPSFQEERTTQMAAMIARHCGGRINHMKLIKLMYLVERESIARHGRRVTFDWLVSMKNGPVLSATLDRINEVDPPAPEQRTYWQQYFTPRENNHVTVRGPVPTDLLSRSEREIVEDVLAKFGHMDQWQLRDWCHDHLPEWKDPGASRSSIDVRVILESSGFEADEIDEVLSEMKSEEFARTM